MIEPALMPEEWKRATKQPPLCVPFTWDDVDALRQAAVSVFDAVREGDGVAGTGLLGLSFERAEVVSDACALVADRIEALLPPRGDHEDTDRA